MTMTDTMSHSGPFETQRQAITACQHVYDSPPGTGAWGDGNHRMLEDACRAAGVELGAFDYRILVWLAGWEPSTCAVVAGLITRAHRLTDPRPALLRAALADAIAYREGRGATECADCDAAPAGLCGDHTDDMAKAADYQVLARELEAGQ